MGKLLILSLEETEQSVYEKIMKIVHTAGIVTAKEKIENTDKIQIGVFYYAGAAPGFKAE